MQTLHVKQFNPETFKPTFIKVSVQSFAQTMVNPPAPEQPGRRNTYTHSSRPGV